MLEEINSLENNLVNMEKQLLYITVSIKDITEKINKQHLILDRLKKKEESYGCI